MDRLLVVSVALTVVGGIGIAWALPQLANGAAELLGALVERDHGRGARRRLDRARAVDPPPRGGALSLTA